MRRLRLAVIGAGHLGRIHTRLASSLAHVELVGIVDPLESARHQLAQEFQITPLAHHGQLAGHVDAAIVATPTQHHHAVGVDLLRAGVHLLVEKPLARTTKESAELVAAAQQHGTVLQVGHVERFNPAFEAVVPEVYKPKYIESVRTSGYTFRSTDIGAVLDIMIHDLDIILYLVRSDIVDVQALGISVFGGHEDMAQARLHFANGCVANLTAARCSFEIQRRMQIFSESGYASVDFANRKGAIVRPDERLLRREIDFESLTPAEKKFLQDNLFQQLLPRSDIEIVERNAILHEQQEFLRSIHTGMPPRVDGLQAHLAISVAETILDKIAAHRWTEDLLGPAGTMFTPIPPILPGPMVPTADNEVRRKAG